MRSTFHLIAAVSLAACSTHRTQHAAALQKSCPDDPTPDPVIAIRQDARNALRAEASGNPRGARFDLELFEQDIDVRSSVVERDVRTRRVTADPRGTLAVPEERLRVHGFVRSDGDSFVLLGPTPELILSDWFTATHCFGVTEDGGRSVGLTFQPHPDRIVPDLRGTLWLDSGRSTIQRVEFEYVNLPSAIPAGPYQGGLEYARLPSGRVFLRRWTIASPILEPVPTASAGRRGIGVRIAAMRRIGGEVIRAVSDGDTVHRAFRASVSGIVFDSTSNVPLTGVRVSLAGTGYGTTTDSSGRYTLGDLPPGRYRIAFEHHAGDASTTLLDPFPVDLTAAWPRTVSVFLLPHTVARRIAVSATWPARPGAGDMGMMWMPRRSLPTRFEPLRRAVALAWPSRDPGRARDVPWPGARSRTPPHAAAGPPLSEPPAILPGPFPIHPPGGLHAPVCRTSSAGNPHSDGTAADGEDLPDATHRAAAPRPSSR